jgi:hypothetical protein
VQRLYHFLVLQPADAQSRARRETLPAGANLVLSVVLCLLAVWAGFIAANALNQLRGT